MSGLNKSDSSEIIANKNYNLETQIWISLILKDQKLTKKLMKPDLTLLMFLLIIPKNKKELLIWLLML
jgi:hypothetical protein